MEKNESDCGARWSKKIEMAKVGKAARARLHVWALCAHALGTAVLRELAAGEAGVVAGPVRGSGAPSGWLSSWLAVQFVGAAHMLIQARPPDTQGHSIRRRQWEARRHSRAARPLPSSWYKAGLAGGRAGYCSGVWPDLLIWGWPGTLGRILMSAAKIDALKLCRALRKGLADSAGRCSPEQVFQTCGVCSLS